ncbi:hypothetical protein ACWDBO_50990 [Streptomyces mirabilis]
MTAKLRRGGRRINRKKVERISPGSSSSAAWRTSAAGRAASQT